MGPTNQAKYDHMEVVNGTKALRPGWGGVGVGGPGGDTSGQHLGVPSSRRRPPQALRRDL